MSLLAPLFLLGLLAAIIPWWLHRLSSNNPPLQDFGSSMFLEPSETMSSKQTRLRYRTLLSLRVLVLGLLALLFAEPVINGIKLPGNSDNRHLLIIDTSLSQNHTARWQRTRTLAADILDAIPAGEEIAVISAGARLVQSGGIGSDDLSLSAARGYIAALQPGLGRLDYGRIASAVSGVVKDSRLPVVVHFVSDMQKSAMPEKFADLAIDSISQLKLYSSAAPADSNISVSAQVDYAADKVADLTAVINNHSNAEITRKLDIVSGAGVLDTVTVEVPAGTSKVQQFTNLDTSNANGILTVTLTPNDDLSIDDSWTLAVPDGERSEISIVSGTTSSIATSYVTAAVESDPRYRKREIAGDSLSASDAGAFVIVPDASVLSDRAANRLQQYISNGGSALIMVGNTPHGSQMRKLLGVAAAPAGFSSNAQDTAIQSETVAKIDPTHPLTNGVSNNWRALSMLRYLPLGTNDTDRRIIDLGNGSPLLLERTLGDGKILVFSSALDVTWNNLAIEPLFVAFIVRSIEYLSGDTTTNPYRSVGDTISLPPGAQIQNPKGVPLREIEQLANRGAVVLESPGVYTIQSATGKKTLSVNSDPLESNITSISDESQARWRNLTATTASETTTTADTKQNTNKGFWRWLLPLLAILALIESLFSHRHLLIKRGA